MGLEMNLGQPDEKKTERSYLIFRNPGPVNVYSVGDYEIGSGKTPTNEEVSLPVGAIIIFSEKASLYLAEHEALSALVHDAADNLTQLARQFPLTNMGDGSSPLENSPDQQ